MLSALNSNLKTGTHHLLVVKTCFILVSLFSFSVRTSRYVVLCNEIKTFLWLYNYGHDNSKWSTRLSTEVSINLSLSAPSERFLINIRFQAKMVSLNMPLKHCCVQANCPQLQMLITMNLSFLVYSCSY